MTRLLFTAGMSIVFVVFLAPRTFTAFDRRITRARITHGHPETPKHQPSFASRNTRAFVPTHELFDLLASAVVSGESSRHALLRLIDECQVSGQFRSACERNLGSPEPFDAVVHRIKRDLVDTDVGVAGTLLELCVADGVFVSTSLRHAADLLRHDLALERLTSSHTAHARLTMRLLSMLPVAFLVFGSVVSRSFASQVFSPVGIVCTIAAVSLNLSGWLWASRLIARTGKTDGERGLHLLVMAISVSLHAGHSVAGACHRLGSVNDCGWRIATRLDQHQPLDAALEELVIDFAESGETVRRVILDCASSGLPMRRMVEQLSDTMRQRHATAVATRAQQLSTVLSLPIVLCVLPSFALAVLMPLLMASLGSLTSSM